MWLWVFTGQVLTGILDTGFSPGSLEGDYILVVFPIIVELDEDQ